MGAHGTYAAAFLFTFGASLATTIGSMAAFFVRLHDRMVLASSLGLSAGVMLYVSFVEIYDESRDKFKIYFEGKTDIKSSPFLHTTVFFFLGMLLIGVLDLIVHHVGESSHHEDEVTVTAGESTDVELEKGQPTFKTENDRNLKRASLVAALAVALHNIPEGLTTFISTLSDCNSGLSVSIAIGIHNVLEGLCVAMPLYFATGSRWRAFLWSAASGGVEFLGAVLGYVLMSIFVSDYSFGAISALVAGMMVFVSTRELLPLAHRYDPTDRCVTWSVFAGMFLMAICLTISETSS
uniref:Zinc transporter ZupT n=1 Tax=Spongospora subterranea TaxID=70186 RepID=A0A0H5R785_9EUKA|eukprot:CRZ09973.1 hypothetical protein [Spongospora subterranea]